MGFNPSNTSLIQQPSWIRRSTEGDETVLRLHWKLGYAPVQSGYFPLHDKLCFPSWTAKQRLQVLIPKEPHSIQLLVLVPSSKIWAKSISYLVDPFSSGHIFRTCSHSFYFFFCTYLWSAGRVCSNHHVSSEETPDTSGLYYLFAVIKTFRT